MAQAYGFNGAEINANPYNPTDGQNQPYKQGRKNIFSYSAIPHNNSPWSRSFKYLQGEDLTKEDILKFVSSYAIILINQSNNNLVLVGRDARESGVDFS